MSSGDYGGLHDKLLRKLGDPVMPARLEHKARIGNLLDRVGIAHPVLEQFWPYYLVIPGEDDAAPLVGCVAIEMVGDVALLRMLAVAPERRGEGLGYVLVEAATERARIAGRAPPVPGHRRRAGLLRREAGLRRRSIARTSSRRSRRPPSTRWRDRRTRPGCARSYDGGPIRWTHERARSRSAIAREAGRILLEGWGTRPADRLQVRGHQPRHRVRQALGGADRRAAGGGVPGRSHRRRGGDDPRRRDRRRAARLVRRSARRHDQLRARHAAVLGVAGAGDRSPPGAGRRRGAGARLVVRGHDARAAARRSTASRSRRRASTGWGARCW